MVIAMVTRSPTQPLTHLHSTPLPPAAPLLTPPHPLTITPYHSNQSQSSPLQPQTDHALSPGRPTPRYDPSDVRQIMLAMLHAADLGNAAKPTPLHARWACRVMAEFFREAEMQRELGMAPLPIMDPKAVRSQRDCSRWNDPGSQGRAGLVCTSHHICHASDTHSSPSPSLSQCYVPAVQIDFLEFVVGPLFASLSKLLPDVTPALERIAANHAFW